MKKSVLRLAVSAAILGSAVHAHAGSDVGQTTLGVAGMWTETDSDRVLDDDYGFSYSIGHAISERWDFSLNLFSGNHDDLAPGATWDREIKGATLDFARVFDRESRVSPFILMGAGIVDQRRIDGPDKEVAAKLGVGLTADLVYDICHRIDGFPRHLGIHSGGVVIADRPLHRVVPVEWGQRGARSYAVDVLVRAVDRKWLLKDLTNVIATGDSHVLGVNSRVDGARGTAELRFALKPLPGATGYNAQIAQDAGFLDVIDETSTASTEVVLPPLADGNYFVRVTGIELAGGAVAAVVTTRLRTMAEVERDRARVAAVDAARAGSRGAYRRHRGAGLPAGRLPGRAHRRRRRAGASPEGAAPPRAAQRALPRDAARARRPGPRAQYGPRSRHRPRSGRRVRRRRVLAARLIWTAVPLVVVVVGRPPGSLAAVARVVAHRWYS